MNEHTNIKELFDLIMSKDLSESKILELASMLLMQVSNVKNSNENNQSELANERYEFVKVRIIKSKAKKTKSLKKTIISYFRGREGGISNSEVDRIVKRLVGEKVLTINSNDDVEYL